MLANLFVICIYIFIDTKILYLFIIPKMDDNNKIKKMIFEKNKKCKPGGHCYRKKMRNILLTWSRSKGISWIECVVISIDI